MQRRSAKQGSTPPGQPLTAHEKYLCHSHDNFVASRHSNAHSDLHDAAFFTLNIFKCLLFNKNKALH